jgi:hypothetical protein
LDKYNSSYSYQGDILEKTKPDLFKNVPILEIMYEKVFGDKSYEINEHLIFLA